MKAKIKVCVLSMFALVAIQIVEPSNPGLALEAPCRQEVINKLEVETSDYAFTVSDCDLSGFDFSGLNLWAEFNRVNLSGANFSNSNLDLVLNNSNLTNSDFTSAELRVIIQNQSVFESANLTGTTLEFVSCREADLSELNLTAAKEIKVMVRTEWVDCTLPARYLEFGLSSRQGVIGPKVNLIGSTDIARFDIKFTSQPYVDLAESDLRQSHLPEKWSYKLDGANLDGALIYSRTAWGCNIKGQPDWLPSPTSIVGNCFFGPGGDFSGYNLSGLNMDGVELYDSNLTGSNITGTRLEKAYLQGVKGFSLIGIPKSLPVGYHVKFGYLLGPTVNLINANLSKRNLSSIDFSSCRLDGAKLDTTILTKANLTGCIMAGSSITNTHLTKSNLSFADLSNANLYNSNLTGANINSTNLGSAKLTNVSSGGLLGKPKSLPKNWKLLGGYLVGPGSKLVNAKLAKLNLAGMDLSKANVKGADLTGTNLSGTNLQGVSLAGAKLGGAILVNAKLDSKSNGARVTGKPKSLPKGWKLVAGVLKKS
jgi:uncharacterized protein YjbI with pentapeptide repeats